MIYADSAGRNIIGSPGEAPSRVSARLLAFSYVIGLNMGSRRLTGLADSHTDAFTTFTTYTPRTLYLQNT
jgi:hypothetical protein